jgi:hypothetical protein
VVARPSVEADIGLASEQRADDRGAERHHGLRPLLRRLVLLARHALLGGLDPLRQPRHFGA